MKRLFGIMCALLVCVAMTAGNPKVVSGKKEAQDHLFRKNICSSFYRLERCEVRP